MSDELFTILLDGVTLADGTHIQGYELVNFHVLGGDAPTPDAVVAAIRKLDPARPWENVA